MSTSVSGLASVLKTKQENLDQYLQESKEHKAQRSKEIEELKKQRQELGATKRTNEKELME